MCIKKRLMLCINKKYLYSKKDKNTKNLNKSISIGYKIYIIKRAML